MAKDFKVTMNEYLPLRDVVFNTLRQAILKGELEPGERLMEIQLAEALGVSRTPVREGYERTGNGRFVIMIPRRGTYVSDLSLKDITQVFEIRTVMEELAASLAAVRITEEELAELERILVMISGISVRTIRRIFLRPMSSSIRFSMKPAGING